MDCLCFCFGAVGAASPSRPSQGDAGIASVRTRALSHSGAWVCAHVCLCTRLCASAPPPPPPPPAKVFSYVWPIQSRYCSHQLCGACRSGLCPFPVPAAGAMLAALAGVGMVAATALAQGPGQGTPLQMWACGATNGVQSWSLSEGPGVLSPIVDNRTSKQAVAAPPTPPRPPPHTTMAPSPSVCRRRCSKHQCRVGHQRPLQRHGHPSAPLGRHGVRLPQPALAVQRGQHQQRLRPHYVRVWRWILQAGHRALRCVGPDPAGVHGRS
jgi:hypothetical protein